MREVGYKGVIVALTANALIGNDELFMNSGFDGFLAKPIDLRLLNSTLNRFVRDKHPLEAAKYETARAEVALNNASIDPKLIKIFCRDAGKAIVVLRETLANDDISLFTTTIHAMKSALANIGERDASDMASRLEEAGLNGDKEYMVAHVDSFIDVLEALIESLTLAKPETDDNSRVIEDTSYLIEQLHIIMNACEEYDDTAIYAALDCLKEKPWLPKTTLLLEEIYDALFLHSDFEDAVKKARAMTDGH
jgi:HPt (histidine-containing phosphotransfer) domain-containing protein